MTISDKGVNRKIPTHGVVSFKQDHPTTLITSRQIISGMIELDGRYNVGCTRGCLISRRVLHPDQPCQGYHATFCNVLHITLITEAPSTLSVSKFCDGIQPSGSCSRVHRSQNVIHRRRMSLLREFPCWRLCL